MEHFTPFVSSASTTRPVDAAGRSPNTCAALLITETAGSAARVKVYHSALAKPASAPTPAENVTAGNVTIGNHKVKVTYVTAQGETEPSSASASLACAGSKQIDLTGIPVLTGDGAHLVTGRNVYMNEAGRNEIQTLTLTAGATADTFKLTYDAVESDAVTLPAPDYTGTTVAQIQAAIDTIPALLGKATVSGATGGPFAITFSGSLADTDVGDITVTSKVGAADGSVAETLKGVAQGTTWYKVTAGSDATLGNNTATTLTINLSDATLAGYTAAPSANTSGVLIQDIRLAASQTFYMDLPNGPSSAYLARCEIITGAAQTLLYGR